METLLTIYLISIVFCGLFCYNRISKLHIVKVKHLLSYFIAIVPLYNTVLGFIWFINFNNELYDINARLNKVVWRNK